MDNVAPPPGLLQRIAGGDETAVSRCLDQYGGLVWSLARKMCPNDAEDATQEIFVEIWQKAHKFDPERSSEAGFIALVARRRLIDRIRSGRSKVATFAPGEDEWQLTSSPSADPLEVADEAAKAANCMKKLSDEQQKILALSIHHGTSQSKIADQLGMPLGTVKSFARRALIQVRDCMGRPASSLEGGVS